MIESEIFNVIFLLTQHQQSIISYLKDNFCLTLA
jgi:hypothetical protein